jgi:uncharacterized protein involved in exopolysaccharide biosynthesis
MDDPQSATSGPELPNPVQDLVPVGPSDRSETQSGKIFLILRLFWVKRRTIMRIAAAGILLSVLYAFQLPVMYTSTTTLMPPESASPNSNLMSLLSTAVPVASAGSAMLGARMSSVQFVGILRSRTVQERLVARFDLVHYYKSRLMENACKRLAANTQITEDQKSGIITISVKAGNPVLASNIAQGYVEELDHIVTNNNTSAARRERIFLEGRLKEIKQDLDNSAKALSLFSTKSRTIAMPSQAKAMVDAGLNLQEKLATARSDLAGLRQTFSEDNVRVRTASARVEELQRQMNMITGLSQESGSRVNPRESDYPSLGALPALGLTYAELERNVIVEEALWEALTKQYEAAKVQEAKEIPTVRVLDAANVPQHKSSPVRSAIVILGAMASLFIACMFVLGANAWGNMDAQDERKKLATEIVDTMRHSQRWIWYLPGMQWAYARLFRRP